MSKNIENILNQTQINIMQIIITNIKNSINNKV
jgi:hypothetical protein